MCEYGEGLRSTRLGEIEIWLWIQAKSGMLPELRLSSVRSDLLEVNWCNWCTSPTVIIPAIPSNTSR